jgi:outer membrane biosynthesis protein TonB
MINRRFVFMKKYICILAGAALLAACEQKTETAAPAPSPASSPEAATTTAVDTSTPPPATDAGGNPVTTPTPMP